MPPTSTNHGHPLFYKILEELADLHSKKNADYADQEQPLGNFDRVAELCDKYKLFESKCPSRVKVAIVYMLKQFDCFMHSVGSDKQLKVESLEDRLRDIAVYSILIRILNQKK